jgi:hypothetical protein
LLWLCCLLAAAVSSAAAQGEVFVRAQLYPDTTNGPNVTFRVGSLLDDPTWRAALNNYPLRLHWKVQAFRQRGLIDQSGPSSEWDAQIERDPVLGLYVYTFRPPGEPATRTSFNSVDSLRIEIGQPWQVNFQRALGKGSWYYLVWLDITTLTDADLSSVQRYQNRGDDQGGLYGLVQRLLLGAVVPKRSLGPIRTRAFVVR